jgi:hypothetical protein
MIGFRHVRDFVDHIVGCTFFSLPGMQNIIIGNGTDMIQNGERAGRHGQEFPHEAER